MRASVRLVPLAGVEEGTEIWFQIPLAPSGKSPIALRASRARSRGAFRDRHERWARDAMDAGASPDVRRQRGRRSRVVLMPRRWHQVGGAIRQRWWQESPITRESAKEAVKTNRAGKAGLFRRTCGDYARVLYSFGREAAGAHKHPAFPAPSIDEGPFRQSSGKTCRENAEPRLVGCLTIKSGSSMGSWWPSVAARRKALGALAGIQGDQQVDDKAQFFG